MSKLELSNLSKHRSYGFTLVEVVVSAVIFVVVAAGVIPLITLQRLSVSTNNIETGAIAVSKRVLDQIRSVDDLSTLPNSSSVVETTLPSGESIATVNYLGRDYNPEIIYCDNTNFCDENSRHVKVRVNYNGNNIYEVETVFTRFE